MPFIRPDTISGDLAKNVQNSGVQIIVDSGGPKAVTATKRTDCSSCMFLVKWRKCLKFLLLRPLTLSPSQLLCAFKFQCYVNFDVPSPLPDWMLRLLLLPLIGALGFGSSAPFVLFWTSWFDSATVKLCCHVCFCFNHVQTLQQTNQGIRSNSIITFTFIIFVRNVPNH